MKNNLINVKIVNWGAIVRQSLNFNDSVLFVGETGSGKTTIIDAIYYCLTTSANFNLAASPNAKKKENRNLVEYIRGMASSNEALALRKGDTSSYISLTFRKGEKYRTFIIGFDYTVSNNKLNPYYYIIDDLLPDDCFSLKDRAKTNKEFTDYVRSNIENTGIKCDLKMIQSKYNLSVAGWLHIKDLSKFDSLLVSSISITSTLKNTTLEEWLPKHFLMEKIFSTDGTEELLKIIKETEINMIKAEEEKKILNDVEDNYHQMNECNLDKAKAKLAMCSKDKTKEEDILAEAILLKGDYETSLNQLDIEYKRLEAEELIKNNELNFVNENLKTKFPNISTFEQNKQVAEKEITRLKPIINCKNNEIQEFKSILSTVDILLLPHIEQFGYTPAFSDIEKNITIEGNYAIEAIYQSKESTFNKHLTDYKNAKKSFVDDYKRVQTEVQALKENKMPLFLKDYGDVLGEMKQYIAKNNGIPVDALDGKVDLIMNLISIKPESNKWVKTIEGYLGKLRFNYYVSKEYYFDGVEFLDSYMAKQNDISGKKFQIKDIAAIPQNVDVKENSIMKFIRVENSDLLKLFNFKFGRTVMVDNDKVKYIRNEHTFDRSLTYLSMDGSCYKDFGYARLSNYDTRFALCGAEAKKRTREELESILSRKEKKYNEVVSFIELCEEIQNTYLTKLLRHVHIVSDKNYMKDFVDLNLQKNALARAEENLTKYKNREYIEFDIQRNKLTQEIANIKILKSKSRESIDSTNRSIGEYENKINENEKNISDLKAQITQICKDNNLTLISILELLTISSARLRTMEDNNRINSKKCEDACLLAMGNYVSLIHSNSDITLENFEYYQNVNIALGDKQSEMRNNIVRNKAELNSIYVNRCLSKLYEEIRKGINVIYGYSKNISKKLFGKDRYRIIVKMLDDLDSSEANIRLRSRFIQLIHSQFQEDDEIGNRDLFHYEDHDALINNLNNLFDGENDSDFISFVKKLDYRDFISISFERQKDGEHNWTNLANEKKGSLSGGEQQTFLYLLVGLAFSSILDILADKEFQLPVLMDEVFYGMSTNRIKEIIDFYEENNLQIFSVSPKIVKQQVLSIKTCYFVENQSYKNRNVVFARNIEDVFGDKIKNVRLAGVIANV